MARSRRGYSGYRGRRTLNDRLKVVAAVLAVLVALMLGALFLGQDYIVYTDNGLRLDLPFSREKEPAPPDLGDVSVLIQPEDTQSQEPEEPEPEPQPETPALLALELPVEAVLDGSAPEKLKEAGANALVLEMKDREGKLAWPSRQPLALSAGAAAGDEGLWEALEKWNQGDVYTVARVCCFRDNTMPYHRNDMAVRASYGNWRDQLGLRWMDPYSAQVQSYLTDLCVELAQLGFDEILLEDCAFPTGGNLGAITWREQGDPAETVEGFLAQVEQALEPYGVMLSLRTERTALAGENGGLTAGVLERHAGRLWMPRDEENSALAEALSTAGVTGPEERLVELGSALNGETGRNQAVLLQS